MTGQSWCCRVVSTLCPTGALIVQTTPTTVELRGRLYQRNPVGAATLAEGARASPLVRGISIMSTAARLSLLAEI